MSFRIKQYKEVSRSYFERILTRLDNSSFESKLIRSELKGNGYNSFNKHVCWWRLNYGLSNQIVSINPIYDNYD